MRTVIFALVLASLTLLYVRIAPCATCCCQTYGGGWCCADAPYCGGVFVPGCFCKPQE